MWDLNEVFGWCFSIKSAESAQEMPCFLQPIPASLLSKLQPPCVYVSESVLTFGWLWIKCLWVLWLPGVWRLQRLTGPTPFQHSASIQNNRLHHCTPFTPPGLFTTSLHLHFPSVWTSSHPLSGRQREAIKWEEKQLAAPLCPVWGNEIACPIVACNGEQSGVNWGEIGH